MYVFQTRFTARVSELLAVLKDMEKGVYQRTMVSAQPGDTSEAGTHTHNHAHILFLLVIKGSLSRVL